MFRKGQVSTPLSIKVSDIFTALLHRFYFLRRSLGIRSFHLVELQDFPAKNVEVCTSGSVICSVPNYAVGGITKASPVTAYPALKLSILSEAIVTLNHRFPSVLVGDKCVIQNRLERGPFLAFKGGTAYRTANIIGQKGSEIFIKKFSVTPKYGSAIYVGTRSTYNWSHWLINFLPGIYLVNHFADLPKSIPVIVPKSAMENAAFVEALDIVLEGRSVEAIGEGDFFSYDSLCWIDPPAYDGPFAAEAGERIPLVWHKEALQSYVQFLQNHISDEIPLSGSGMPRRIYIDRPAGGPRPVEVENLDEVLGSFDVHKVRMEDYSLAQKTSLLRAVDSLIAPSGSGLANLLFANRGIKVLSFSLQQAPEYDNFVPNLVELMEGTMSLFSITTTQGVDNSSSFVVLESLMREQLSAFLRTEEPSQQ